MKYLIFVFCLLAICGANVFLLHRSVRKAEEEWKKLMDDAEDEK